jgi:Rieske Fe-S protein
MSESVESTDKCSCRRHFLKTAVAAGVGAVAVGTPLCAGTRIVLSAAAQQSAAGKFYPLTTLDSLTDKPQKFSIVDDKKDAWTTLTNQKIGSLYLRKSGDTAEAFHSLCPHAGCMIQVGTKKNPKTGKDEEMFYCPCHAAHFDLDGKRLDTVSPRDLDTLETKIEDGKVLVKFENYTFGITERKKG